jgi:glycosyltransferase involved in cell wall biosynthesis
VLFFGRLQRYKGLDVLVTAMQDVWASRPEVRLLVLGDGPEARRLPDDARVEASIGYVPEAAADTAFRRASLVVLPYVQASQSGVGMLALARGVPTVVTSVGSLPELALSSAFVVPPADPAALARAILAQLDHGPDVRRAVLRRARDEFGWDRLGARALRLYEELLRARRRGA